jgi:hypothetical protein
VELAEIKNGQTEVKKTLADFEEFKDTVERKLRIKQKVPIS